MNKERLKKAIKTLQDAFPNEEALGLFVTKSINNIKKDLKEIITEELKLDANGRPLNEKESIFNASGEYFNKSSITYKKYKEDSLIKYTEFLFDENVHYIEKIYNFVENRYLTLICIFGGPNDVAKETCEKCLSNPKVNEQQAGWPTACKWSIMGVGSTLACFGIYKCYRNYHR